MDVAPKWGVDGVIYFISYILTSDINEDALIKQTNSEIHSLVGDLNVMMPM